MEKVSKECQQSPRIIRLFEIKIEFEDQIGNFPVKFFMKCDDDAFVNVPNLIHILLGGTVGVYAATLSHHSDQTKNTLWPENRLRKFDNLLMGCGMCNQKPKRNSRSKVYKSHST